MSDGGSFDGASKPESSLALPPDGMLRRTYRIRSCTRTSCHLDFLLMSAVITIQHSCQHTHMLSWRVSREKSKNGEHASACFKTYMRSSPFATDAHSSHLKSNQQSSSFETNVRSTSSIDRLCDVDKSTSSRLIECVCLKTVHTCELPHTSAFLQQTLIDHVELLDQFVHVSTCTRSWHQSISLKRCKVEFEMQAKCG